MIIGIDVGGTNTDAALMSGTTVVAATKSATTLDVTSGITKAVTELRHTADRINHIDAVMIGTTHFVNALVEAQHLAKTAVVRLGLPAGTGLPPLVGWPQRILNAIDGQVFMIHGGHEFDGRVISDFKPTELMAAVGKAVANGANSVAIQGIRESMYGADAGAGLSWIMNRTARLYANYDGRFRDGFTSHQGTLGLEVKW